MNINNPDIKHIVQKNLLISLNIMIQYIDYIERKSI